MIKLRNSTAVMALAAASAISVSAPAQAQAIKGVAVVDETKVIEQSAAAKAAEQQMQAQYASNFQQAQQVEQNFSMQAKPLADQFNAEKAKPQPNRQVLQQLSDQITGLQQQSEAQLQQIGQPISIARAFVGEQLSTRIRTAIANVAGRRQATVVVSASSTFYTSPSVDITNDVIAELNRDTSPVSVVPSQQWLQAKGVGQSSNPGTAPVTPQPEGR